MLGIHQLPVALLQSGIVPKGTRVNVFQQIYWVFLVLGTIVGIVVISYMLYNAYKYREGGEKAEKVDIERPQLGELPEGGGGGRKLFLSFALSALIVISLIAWTYGTLLYVETGAAQQPQVEGADGEPLEIKVVGYQFGWRFVYENGKTLDSGAGDQLRVPANRMVELNVTSSDVMHNIGIPELRAKTDAMPGQYTRTWLLADDGDVGNTYTARCYELCGSGHSYMTAQVQVMSQSDFQEWYTQEEESEGSDGSQTDANSTDTGNATIASRTASA